MKTILIDLLSAQPAAGSKFHGGGEYIKTIFKKLVEEASKYERIIACFFDKNKFIDEWIMKIIEEKDIKTFQVKRFSEVNTIFEKEQIDVFYTGLVTNYFNIYFPAEVLKVGTLHGLRNIEKSADRYGYLYKDSFKYKIKQMLKILLVKQQEKKYVDLYSSIVKRMDKIICVSEYTRNAIICNMPSEILHEIEVYYTPEKSSDSQDCEKVTDKGYILLIGGDRWIKNVFRAMKSIDALLSKKLLKNMKVIVVGKISKSIQNKIKNKSYFIFKDYVSTEELEVLYQECSFFVYPTLNEGFGMPPLEAMRYGKTCVVSATTSLPEICGNAVYYVNPYDIQEIENKIYQAYEKRLDTKRVLEQYEYIRKRRENDLEKAAEYILKA